MGSCLCVCRPKNFPAAGNLAILVNLRLGMAMAFYNESGWDWKLIKIILKKAIDRQVMREELIQSMATAPAANSVAAAAAAFTGTGAGVAPMMLA